MTAPLTEDEIAAAKEALHNLRLVADGNDYADHDRNGEDVQVIWAALDELEALRASRDEAARLREQAERASAELRHAFREKTDWNLVSRAIQILERAALTPKTGETK